MKSKPVFKSFDTNKSLNSEIALNHLNLALDEVLNSKIQDQAQWVEGYMQNSSPRLHRQLCMILEEAKTEDKILEYGSAPFIFTKALSLLGYDVVGTDIAPERFENHEKLQLDIRKIDFDMENMPFKDNCFDMLFCSEVFEHLRFNLIKTFKESYRVLKPNGKLVISTPNLRSLIGIYRFLIQDKCYSCADNLYDEWNKINRIGHMGHVREYTYSEIASFFNKLGFVPEKVFCTGETPPKTIKTKIVHTIEQIFPQLKPNLTIIFTKH